MRVRLKVGIVGHLKCNIVRGGLARNSIAFGDLAIFSFLRWFSV